MTQNKTLKFSGHETFICRQFWPKKGYDFLKDKNKFTEPEAVVTLGVGKNMVTSIRFWLKAIGIVNQDDQLNEIADLILDDNGYDPYIEDIGTIWLLHYLLVKKDYASIYNLIFNDFRKERIQFTRNQLHSYLKRKCLEISPNTYNQNTINSDIKVFIKNYLSPNHKQDKINIEDDLIGLFQDLKLLHSFKTDENIEQFKIDSKERESLPPEIFLYSILDNENYTNAITIDDLRIKENSPGLLFAMNSEGIYDKINQLEKMYDQILFSKTAGNQILQIDSEFDKTTILKNYYGK
jgi:translation elongation factor P/translation initiation factor 5A